MSDTLALVTEVFREVFEDDDLQITTATTARDIEEWDSLTHVSLIVALEQRLNVRFSSADVARLADVGELVGLIERQRGGG